MLIAAIGLIPIALSYGLYPNISLDYLFQISVADLNATHMFRAIMGLYLSMAIFWIAGAINAGVRQVALYSLVVFMLGLALGRIISLVIDGMPDPLLVFYLILELIFAVVGIVLLRKID